MIHTTSSLNKRLSEIETKLGMVGLAGEVIPFEKPGEHVEINQRAADALGIGKIVFNVVKAEPQDNPGK